MVNLSDIQQAATRIAPHAHRTPVLTCATLDERAGRRLYFKCENFQKVGAFKFRGACNAVMKLSDDVARRGVVTHSSGNHAQALALAARIRGIRADVVMPHNSSAVKVRAVQGYGAAVHFCEPNQQARESTAAAIVQSRGATLVPPYDHDDIIAGQGTAAMELIQEVKQLDAIIAPVGGGGLMSGTCIASRSLLSGIQIVGAEPAGADDAARSLAAGQLMPSSGPRTIADGLLTGMSERTWSIISANAHRIITVSEDQIIAAMRLVWERMKIVIEPSSAVVVAAALSDEFREFKAISRVGLIISGGNVDLDKLPWR